MSHEFEEDDLSYNNSIEGGVTEIAEIGEDGAFSEENANNAAATPRESKQEKHLRLQAYLEERALKRALSTIDGWDD